MSRTEILPGAHRDCPDAPSVEDRQILDQLLRESLLYRSTREYRELYEFAIRLRNMAPFNAMLLQIQKPGLRFAASAEDWRGRFGRKVRPKSRPLLILWPFGPVALVYDVLDTEGPELPEDVFSFYASGPIHSARIERFRSILEKSAITPSDYDSGDGDAGFIQRLTRSGDKKTYSRYRLGFNRNHAPSQTFVTIAHELAHLFLGHLGDDAKLGVPDRTTIPHARREIEAESVAYLVCRRNGVESRSLSYLSDHLDSEHPAPDLDLYSITRAAGRIEELLRLNASKRRPRRAPRKRVGHPELDPWRFDRRNLRLG